MVNNNNEKISRRAFLFTLATVSCLPFAKSAQAAVGLFDPFSFAYITDVHLTSGVPDTFKMLQESQLFLQDVVKALNAEKLDFIVFGGDQVEKPGQNDANWQLFLDVVQGLNCPWTFVLGEQDVSGPPAVDKMRTYGPDWKGKGIETNQPYWSQSPLPGVHLIGLDTSKAGTVTGDLSSEQLEWLKEDLKSNPRRFTIVFSHHPLLAPSPYDSGPPWDEYVVPQGALAREILGSSKYVRLALSGHVHMTKIQQERDLWYVSNPSLAVFPCAYRIFHVTPETVTVETYQVQFPALIKKARALLVNSQLAFKYNEKDLEAFPELALGDKLDRDAVMPLSPGGQLEPVNRKRKKKEKEQQEQVRKEPPAPQNEPKKERKKRRFLRRSQQEEPKAKVEESTAKPKAATPEKKLPPEKSTGKPLHVPSVQPEPAPDMTSQ